MFQFCSCITIFNRFAAIHELKFNWLVRYFEKYLLQILWIFVKYEQNVLHDVWKRNATALGFTSERP